MCKKSSNFAAQNMSNMKKFLSIALVAVMVFGFSSCRKNGENEPQQKFHIEPIELPVSQEEWQFDTIAQRFFVHFELPQLTRDIYNYGTWNVSREYNYGTVNAYQVALPETSYMVEDELDTDGNPTGNKFYYAQHIDYAVGTGWAEITLTISDYVYEEGWKPEGMNFLVQLIY